MVAAIYWHDLDMYEVAPQKHSTCASYSTFLDLVVFSIFAAFDLLNVASVLSDWWSCFLSSLVFCLFACGIFICAL